MTEKIKPILAATCGNVDAGDDAFGPAVGRAVAAMGLAGVEVVDLDIRPTAVLDHLAGRQALVIVDALEMPGQVGQLVDVDWFDPDRPVLIDDDTMSSHGLSLGNQLDLARQLGMLPKTVRLIGVGIGSAEIGGAMSEMVRQQVDRAAAKVAGYCRAWASASDPRK